MKIHAKRCLAGLGVFLLIAIGVLIVLEWNRRRQVAAAGPQTLEGAGTTVEAMDIQEQFRSPAEFAKLCADVQEHADALQQRFLRATHTRKTRTTRYDSKGQPEAIAETTYRVHFNEGVEQKQQIERRQLLGKQSFLDPDGIKIEQADLQLIPPFSKDAPEGLYGYRLEGVEELQGRRLLRIHFEPATPVERSFKGSAWIDPVTRELVRTLSSPVKPRLRVDRFEMMLDYGPSENGCNQVRRLTIETAGGFALFTWHFRTETELSDYK
ncbi:MAG TPA: hypothetical protein VN688_23410 [Gemmataceae bacterium]|nr:hypothetical protein [Gemmataceae bacterium]